LANETPFRFFIQESSLFIFLSQFSKGFSAAVERLFNHFVVIETIIYGFFRYAVHSSAKELTANLFSAISNYKSVSILFSKHLVECLVSLYLLVNLFVLVIPSTVLTATGDTSFNTSFSGLSELRSLLYDNFG